MCENDEEIIPDFVQHNELNTPNSAAFILQRQINVMYELCQNTMKFHNGVTKIKIYPNFNTKVNSVCDKFHRFRETYFTCTINDNAVTLPKKKKSNFTKMQINKKLNKLKYLMDNCFWSDKHFVLQILNTIVLHIRKIAHRARGIIFQ